MITLNKNVVSARAGITPSGPRKSQRANSKDRIGGDGMIDYDYDPLNSIIGVLDQDYYYIGYSYRADGQKRSVTVYEPTQTDYDIIYDVYYDYDLAGRLGKVTEPKLAYGSQTLAAFDYDINGNRSKLAYYLDGKESGTPVAIGYTYDEENFLTGYTTTSAGNLTFSFDAADDPCDPCDFAGNIDGLGRLAAAREVLSNDPCDPCSTRTYDLEYSYDLRGELLTNQITFDQDPCSTIGHTFTYHDNGNINSKQVTGQGTTDYSYTGDQMTGVDSQTLVWGKNGNMTTGTSAVIEYNWDNKLRSAEIDESDVLTAVKYDPDGNRVYKEIPGDPGPVKRKYIVDIVGRLPVILLVMDADNNNSVVSSYVYANSQVLAQYDGTQEGANDKHFYLHDRLGSVRLLIDESGDVANTYTYQPFGRIIEDSSDWPQAPSNDFKFTGQWFDSEIDQYYLRARMYDPEVARAATKRPFQIHTNLPSS